MAGCCLPWYSALPPKLGEGNSSVSFRISVSTRIVVAAAAAAAAAAAVRTDTQDLGRVRRQKGSVFNCSSRRRGPLRNELHFAALNGAVSLLHFNGRALHSSWTSKRARKSRPRRFIRFNTVIDESTSVFALQLARQPRRFWTCDSASAGKCALTCD